MHETLGSIPSTHPSPKKMSLEEEKMDIVDTARDQSRRMLDKNLSWQVAEGLLNVTSF